MGTLWAALRGSPNRTVTSGEVCASRVRAPTTPLLRTRWKRRNSTSIRPQCRFVPHFRRAFPTHLLPPTSHRKIRGKAVRARVHAPTTPRLKTTKTVLVSGPRFGLSDNSWPPTSLQKHSPTSGEGCAARHQTCAPQPLLPSPLPEFLGPAGRELEGGKRDKERKQPTKTTRRSTRL